MTPTVSIIISIFNEEKYLKTCLESVINQTLDNIEIIVINDGSTDSSIKILEKYKDKIKIINQENIGLGASRNKGMKIAKGEYMAFLDGDDWLSLDALKKAYSQAKEKDTDITMFQMINYNNETGEKKKNEWFNLDKFNESYEDLVFNSNKTKNFLFHLSVSACQKIYKNSYLKSIDAKFPEGIYFEDNPFFYYVWLKAKRISIIKEYLYYRRSHEGTITYKCDEKFFDIIPSGKILFKIFIDNDFYKDYKKDLINYTINPYRLTINSITENLKEEFYLKAKYEFNNINNSVYKEDFLKYMSKANLKIFSDILKSKNYKEFKKLNINPEGKF